MASCYFEENSFLHGNLFFTPKICFENGYNDLNKNEGSEIFESKNLISQVVIFKKIHFFPVTRFSHGKMDLENGCNVFNENERLKIFESKHSFWQTGIFSKNFFSLEPVFSPGKFILKMAVTT